MKKKIVVISLLGLCIALLVYPIIHSIYNTVIYGKAVAKVIPFLNNTHLNMGWQVTLNEYLEILIPSIVYLALFLAIVAILIVLLVLLVKSNISLQTDLADKRTARKAALKARKIEQLNKQLDELREKDSD